MNTVALVTRKPMNDTSDIYYLQELIDALDRRLPQPHRADSAVLARKSATLRERAIRKLTELGAQPRSTGRAR